MAPNPHDPPNRLRDWRRWAVEVAANTTDASLNEALIIRAQAIYDFVINDGTAEKP